MPKTSPVNSRLYPGSTPKLDVFLLESLPGGVETHRAPQLARVRAAERISWPLVQCPLQGAANIAPNCPKNLRPQRLCQRG